MNLLTFVSMVRSLSFKGLGISPIQGITINPVLQLRQQKHREGGKFALGHKDRKYQTLFRVSIHF